MCAVFCKHLRPLHIGKQVLHGDAGVRVGIKTKKFCTCVSGDHFNVIVMLFFIPLLVPLGYLYPPEVLPLDETLLPLLA